MSVRQRIDSTGKRYWTYRKTVRLLSGKKRRISGRSSINTKAAAENAERAAIELLLNPRPEPEEAGPTPTVAEFAPFFLENHKPDQKPSQQRSKKQILNSCIKPTFGPLRTDEVTHPRKPPRREPLSQWDERAIEIGLFEGVSEAAFLDSLSRD